MRKCSLLLLIVSFAFFLIHCNKEPKEDFTLKIVGLIGNVKIISENINRIPQIDESLKQSETIITGNESIANLIYGNSFLLRINQNSEVKVSSLMKELEGTMQLDLEKGRIFLIITKLLKNSQFMVKTPTAIAAVRGTSFMVTVEKMKSQVSVLKGTVTVNPVEKGKIIEEIAQPVAANQSIEIDAEQITNIKQKKEIKVTKISTAALEKMNEEINIIKIDVTDKLKAKPREIFNNELLIMKGDDTGSKMEDKQADKNRENKPIKKNDVEQSRIVQDKEKATDEMENESTKLIQEGPEKKSNEKQKGGKDGVKNLPTL